MTALTVLTADIVDEVDRLQSDDNLKYSGAALFPRNGAQWQNHGDWCWTIPQCSGDDLESFKTVAVIEFDRRRFRVDYHRNASSAIGHLMRDSKYSLQKLLTDSLSLSRLSDSEPCES